MLNIRLQKIFIIAILVLMFYVNVPHNTLYSETSGELLEQIQQKQKELDETKNSIKDLQDQLKQNKVDLENASEGLPKLEAEVAEIETQVQINKRMLELNTQEANLQKQEKRNLIERQKNSVKTLYLQWRVKNSNINFLEQKIEDLLVEGFSEKVFGVSNKGLIGLNNSIKNIDDEIKNQDKKISLLNSQNKELNFRKEQIKEQIQYFSGKLVSNQDKILDLQDLQSKIISQINDLTLEQKAAAEREAWILRQELTKQRKKEDLEIVNGFYFSGLGRDMYQGHGVGFSQFGAYGGASLGMSAEELIKFYYTGVEFSTQGGEVSIIGGAQNIDVEEYLIHLGEVPDKACGDESQVDKDPEKYVLVGNNVWNCWPEEAIKAQIIIARTYALFHKNLYPDAKSQVYNLSYNKKWAQEETEGLVITYKGNLIDAVYSSDNNQGSGTANNDTVFQNFSGEGTPYEYLRSVDDSKFAHSTKWSNWPYKTSTYNNETILSMLNYLSGDSSNSYDYTIKTSMKKLLDKIGQLQSISFERDPSNRVKKYGLMVRMVAHQ